MKVYIKHMSAGERRGDLFRSPEIRSRLVCDETVSPAKWSWLPGGFVAGSPEKPLRFTFCLENGALAGLDFLTSLHLDEDVGSAAAVGLYPTRIEKYTRDTGNGVGRRGVAISFAAYVMRVSADPDVSCIPYDVLPTMSVDAVARMLGADWREAESIDEWLTAKPALPEPNIIDRSLADQAVRDLARSLRTLVGLGVPITMENRYADMKFSQRVALRFDRAWLERHCDSETMRHFADAMRQLPGDNEHTFPGSNQPSTPGLQMWPDGATQIRDLPPEALAEEGYRLAKMGEYLEEPEVFLRGRWVRMVWPVVLTAQNQHIAYRVKLPPKPVVETSTSGTVTVAPPEERPEGERLVDFFGGKSSW